jgi:hypothetical protein
MYMELRTVKIHLLGGLYLLKNIYLFIKYFKIVFFNKKIRERYVERSGTIWNDMERYGT